MMRALRTTAVDPRAMLPPVVVVHVELASGSNVILPEEFNGQVDGTVMLDIVADPFTAEIPAVGAIVAAETIVAT
jgi:hypothetical protein